MRSATHHGRTMFALLAPVVAFASISAITASGCGGTDTIDDEPPADTALDDSSVSPDGRPDVAPDGSVDSSDGGDALVPLDTLGTDTLGTDTLGTDTLGTDTLGTDTLGIDVGDTRLDAFDALDADTRLDAPDADTRLDVLDAPDVFDALDVLDADGDVRDVGDSGDASSAVPSLGAAASFAVLGGTTVTSTGLTAVNGNVGVWPGSGMTGFPPGVVTGGTIDVTGPTSAAAQASLTTLYNNLKGAACDTDMSGTDLSGKTLKPGVYCFSSSAAILTVGTLTLDAKGDPNAFWIFQVGSTLKTPDGAAVLVINGGSACNVFWQVGSSATLGKLNNFGGNIIAFSSITVATGSTVSGRTLAQGGAVTLDTNAIAFSTCSPGAFVDAGADASDADAGDTKDAGDAGDAGDGG